MIKGMFLLSVAAGLILYVVATSTPQTRLTATEENLHSAEQAVQEATNNLAVAESILKQSETEPPVDKAAVNAFNSCISDARNASNTDGYVTGNTVMPEAPSVFAGIKKQNNYSVAMGCGVDPEGPFGDLTPQFRNLVATRQQELSAAKAELAAARTRLSHAQNAATPTITINSEALATAKPDQDDLPTVMARLRAAQTKESK